MFVINRMTKNPMTVTADTKVDEVAHLMKKHNFRRLPVVDDGKLVGFLSDSDLMRVAPSPATTLSRYEINSLLAKICVRDIMKKDVVSVNVDATIEEAALIMYKNKIGGMPVVSNMGAVVGVITETDIFKTFVDVMGLADGKTRITLEVTDKLGVVKDIAEIFGQAGVSIDSLITCKKEDNKYEIVIRGDITNIDDIPDDFEMTTNQKEEVNNYKVKQTYIDKTFINEFLKQLSYPIYYLDFETYQQAIPLFKGISAYEQIPFQYSLHIEYEDGTLEHKEFLAHEDIDSRYELAKSLVENISSSGTALAYNMSFEKTIIRKLANIYGEFTYDLMNIHNNMQDLMTPFQKRWFVTPAMKGSYSIKYVLPALVPEFEKAYKDLELVHNGSEAMDVYANLKNLSDEEKIVYKKALLEYCKLDTLAMVRILEVLRRTKI